MLELTVKKYRGVFFAITPLDPENVKQLNIYIIINIQTVQNSTVAD